METSNYKELIGSGLNSGHFFGYGDKKLLTKCEIKDALKRIDSYCGVNFCISAPGKLVLFGEHGVMYGTSAVASSINKRTYIRVTENKIHEIFAVCMRDINFSYHASFDKIIKFTNENIPGHDLKPLTNPINDPNEINHEKFLEILKENFEKYFHPVKANREQIISFCVFLYLLHGIFYKEDLDSNEPQSRLLSPLIVDISTELLLGAGIGSSASFSVCVAAGLLHLKNVKIYGLNSASDITFSDQGLELISKWAFNAEKIVHGHSSGTGTAVVTYGSFIEVVHINSKRKFIDIPDSPKIHVLLIDSGVKRNTADLFNNVAIRLYCNPEPFKNILNAIHQVADKAIRLIKSMGSTQIKGPHIPEFQSLEELVTINQGLLHSLGVSHKNIQEICAICSEYNLNTKLSGAGGGGCVYTFVPSDFDEDLLLQCMNKLRDNNYEVYKLQLGGEGVRFEDLSLLKR